MAFCTADCTAAFSVSFLYLFDFLISIFFVNDVFPTLQGGVVIYDTKVDGNLIYYGIVSQPFPAYSTPCLSNLLSLLSLKMVSLIYFMVSEIDMLSKFR